MTQHLQIQYRKMGRIRIRVAGIYIQNGKILLVKHRKAGREYFLLPGGGQEPGETAREALIREWKEELSLTIRPGNFLFAGESTPPRNVRKSQMMQLVFGVLEIQGNIDVVPDGALAGHMWMPLEKLESVAFFPACLPQVMAIARNETPDPFAEYRWLR